MKKGQVPLQNLGHLKKSIVPAMKSQLSQHSFFLLIRFPGYVKNILNKNIQQQMHGRFWEI